MKIYDYQGKKNVSGEMIRQLRIKKRMSQSDLAARLQVEGVMLEKRQYQPDRERDKIRSGL